MLQAATKPRAMVASPADSSAQALPNTSGDCIRIRNNLDMIVVKAIRNARSYYPIRKDLS